MMTIYGSTGTRNLFFASTACLLAASLFFIAWRQTSDLDHSNALWIFTDGILIGSTIVILLLGLKIRTPSRACAFCTRSRQEVGLLISGPHVAICDECIGPALRFSAAESERKSQAIEWQMRILDSLPRHCPYRISQALIESIVQGTGDLGVFRKVLSRCFAVENYGQALAVLQRIPETERTFAEWLNLGVASGNCGRYHEGLNATLRAQEMDQGSDRAIVLNNLAWFHLRAKPEAKENELALWISHVEEAKQLLKAERTPAAESLLKSCYGTEAELRLSLGDGESALRVLAEAEKLGPLNGARLMIRAKIFVSSGQFQEACRDIEKALEDLHPESYDAQLAHKLRLALPVPRS